MMGTILNQLSVGGDRVVASACKVEEEEYIVRKLCWIIIGVACDYYTLIIWMQVDGINLLHIPSKDAYAYARTLLNMLFTKQEQKSVVLKSSKSLKPPSPRRVQKLFGKSMSLQTCTYTIYFWSTFQTMSNEDMDNDLMATLNQKCRDAKPDF